MSTTRILSLSTQAEMAGATGARTLFTTAASSRQSVAVGVGVGATLAVHVAAAASLLAFTNTHQPHAPRPFLSSPRLISVVYIPSPPIELPKLELTALPAPKAVVSPEPAPLKSLLPVRPMETAAIEPAVPKPVPPMVEPPRPALPAPAPPSPTVGVFPDAAAAARAPQIAARVEVAGFDAPVKQTPDSKLGQATVGAFDSAANTGARQAGSKTATNAVVAESGFGKPVAATPPSGQPATVVREGGFGASVSRLQPKTSKPDEVRTAGFGNAVAADTSKRAEALPPPPAQTPVEVLFKPTPVYTEEARRLRIEGDVILEVEFKSAGSLRVIRVVRGLGYGLDEAAVKAAEQIRFKPAQASGKAVDSRNTISIVFRLA